MQSFLMILIAALCGASATGWAIAGAYAAALAFVGFGIGYASLACLFYGAG